MKTKKQREVDICPHSPPVWWDLIKCIRKKHKFSLEQVFFGEKESDFSLSLSQTHTQTQTHTSLYLVRQWLWARSKQINHFSVFLFFFGYARNSGLVVRVSVVKANAVSLVHNLDAAGVNIEWAHNIDDEEHWFANNNWKKNIILHCQKNLTFLPNNVKTLMI